MPSELRTGNSVTAESIEMIPLSKSTFFHFSASASPMRNPANICIIHSAFMKSFFEMTFTYDGSKHDEESFKRKLRGCFKMMCHRKHWKYVGVWERSPEKQRLHFHGLFYIPDGAMPGELVEVKDYSPIKDSVQTTIQNTYFNERFGRSDFKPVEDNSSLGEAIAYLTKYMEKTGEKIVYSKGLPQFFISDVMENDVVCPIGQEDKKLLLFDDFECWDEGEFIGNVSREVIDRMRKVN